MLSGWVRVLLRAHRNESDGGHRIALLYGLLSLCWMTLTAIFNSFHVDVFLNSYHLDAQWWYGGHFTFMIWNAVNDPLIGWIANQYGEEDSSLNNRNKTVARHLKAFKYGGPAMALSFLIPWYSWSDNPLENTTTTGLHFLFALCLWDTLFTYVVLEHCALLRDLHSSPEMRSACSISSSIFCAIGSASVPLISSFYDRDNLQPFRTTCLVVSLLSGLGFVVIGAQLGRATNITNRLPEPVVDTSEMKGKGESAPSLLRFLGDSWRHKPFVAFVMMNFLQVCHSTFNVNFLIPFHDRILGPDGWRRAMITTIGGGVAAISSLYLLHRSRNGEVYPLMLNIFRLKVVLGIAGIVFSNFVSIELATVLVMIGSFAVCESIGATLNIVMSDIIDSDFVSFKRSESMSSAMFGVNALITKPAQSISPMFVVFILSHFPADEGVVVASDDASTLRSSVSVTFAVLVLMPLCAGALQLLIWKRYPLRGEELKEVRRQVKEREMRMDDEIAKLMG